MSLRAKDAKNTDNITKKTDMESWKLMHLDKTLSMCPAITCPTRIGVYCLNEGKLKKQEHLKNAKP